MHLQFPGNLPLLKMIYRYYDLLFMIQKRTRQILITTMWTFCTLHWKSCTWNVWSERFITGPTRRTTIGIRLLGLSSNTKSRRTWRRLRQDKQSLREGERERKRQTPEKKEITSNSRDTTIWIWRLFVIDRAQEVLQTNGTFVLEEQSVRMLSYSISNMIF